MDDHETQEQWIQTAESYNRRIPSGDYLCQFARYRQGQFSVLRFYPVHSMVCIHTWAQAWPNPRFYQATRVPVVHGMSFAECERSGSATGMLSVLL